MDTNQGDDHDEYAARCDFAAHARSEEDHRREIEEAVAQAVVAEREAFRAEIERHIADDERLGADPSAQGHRAELWAAERARRDLLSWLDVRSKLDARSKGGAK